MCVRKTVRKARNGAVGDPGEDELIGLKTEQAHLNADEAWQVCSLVARAESPFSAMKSLLAERPIFRQTKIRCKRTSACAPLHFICLYLWRRPCEIKGIRVF